MKRQEQRVWVVLDKKVVGNGYREEPILGTVARTRAEAIGGYERNRDGAWITGGSYADDKRHGWVRCVRATLLLEQPKRSQP